MPQSRTAVAAGNTLELVAHFRNSAGDLTAASGVSVRIYDQDAAYYETVTPTTPAAGVYVVDYTVPTDAEDGMWQDRWSGILDGQLLEQTFYFNVISSGIITRTELRRNNAITITLSEDIPDADGNLLGQDYEFYFTTEYSPLYTNYNQIALEIGRYLQDVPKDTIWRAILSASLEAERLTRVHPMPTEPATRGTQEEYYLIARRSWVRCKVAELLLVEVMELYDVKRKRLGDVDVTWNPRGLETALDRALSCQQKFLPAMESGGIKIKKPRTFIKGEFDLDRPSFGRMDIPTDTDEVSPRIPAGNARVNTSWTYRRFGKSFRNRKW